MLNALALLIMYFIAVVIKPESAVLLTLPTWIFGILFLLAEIVQNASTVSRLTIENKHEEAMTRLSLGEENVEESDS